MDKHNIILEGIHYSTNKVIRLGIRDGIIYSLANVDDIYWPGEESRDKLPIIAPGLVDLQINGFHGIDFNSEELFPDHIESVSQLLLKQGVTKFFPTLITGSRKRISSGLKAFSRMLDGKGLAAHMIGGIHLEGPFISKEEGPRGAHLKRYCLDPELALVNRWQEEAEGRIRIITLAPELPGSESLIRECVKLGMCVAIGHTDATGDEIRMAVDCGALLSTHLGNGSHSMLPRHPNYIWEQLAEDRLHASIIADGFHLPESVLKVFIRSKKEKAILISDGMPYTGMNPGLYQSAASGKIRLTAEGKLHREGNPGLLTGSASLLIDGVRKIAAMEDFALAWDMASTRPAQLMNHSTGHGLQVGAPADLVLLEGSPLKSKVIRVYKAGMQFNPED